jgi:hypothetical protein
MCTGLSEPISEGVRELPGQPGDTARAQVLPLPASLDQQVAGDHVKALVFRVVDVQRRTQGPGLDYSVNDGEQPAGVCRSGLDRRETWNPADSAATGREAAGPMQQAPRGPPSPASASGFVPPRDHHLLLAAPAARHPLKPQTRARDRPAIRPKIR